MSISNDFNAPGGAASLPKNDDTNHAHDAGGTTRGKASTGIEGGICQGNYTPSPELSQKPHGFILSTTLASSSRSSSPKPVLFRPGDNTVNITNQLILSQRGTSAAQSAVLPKIVPGLHTKTPRNDNVSGASMDLISASPTVSFDRRISNFTAGNVVMHTSIFPSVSSHSSSYPSFMRPLAPISTRLMAFDDPCADHSKGKGAALPTKKFLDTGVVSDVSGGIGPSSESSCNILVGRYSKSSMNSTCGKISPCGTKLNRKYIIGEPTDLDVLLGRGGGANKHPGNIKYRKEVEKIKPRYCHVRTKTGKTDMSYAVVNHVYQYGGRFLEKDRQQGMWFLADPKKARKKCSQALREDTAKLREEARIRAERKNKKGKQTQIEGMKKEEPRKNEGPRHDSRP